MSYQSKEASSLRLCLPSNRRRGSAWNSVGQRRRRPTASNSSMCWSRSCPGLAGKLRVRWACHPKLMEFARGFNLKLAAEGLVVPHWPEPYGGRDAEPWSTSSPARKCGATGSRAARSTWHQLGWPGDHGLWHRRAEARASADARARRGAAVSGLFRAERRDGPCRHEHPRRGPKPAIGLMVQRFGLLTPSTPTSASCWPRSMMRANPKAQSPASCCRSYARCPGAFDHRHPHGR